MNTKLYVDNLPTAITENDLMDIFSPHGNIVGVTLRVDRAGNGSRNFGSVPMATPEGARLAMQTLNGKEIGAFTLVVSDARPNERRIGVVL